VAKSQAQFEAAQKRAQAAQRQQMISILVVAGAAILVFGVLIFFINRTAGGTVTRGKYDGLSRTTTSDGYPIIGDPAAKILIAEFSDFGCPYCLQYKATIDDLITRQVRTGNAALVFIPQNFHDHSEDATRAALCAEKQGKFWEMHDELFAIQSTLGTFGFNATNLRAKAQALNLDTNAWLNCFASQQDKLTTDRAYALFGKVKAEGTPTLMWSKDGGETWYFFSNGGQLLTSGGPPAEIVYQTIADVYSGKL